MGIVMGLVSGALFGLNAVLIKIGMRRSKVDNGHFMSVLVNVSLLGVVMLLVSLPQWSWTGFAGFIVAGLLTTWLGRGTSFVAIRLLGPTRQSIILLSAPLFTAIGGWFFLGEGISVLQGLGGLVVSIGLLVVLQSRLDGKEVAAPVESEVADAFVTPNQAATNTRQPRRSPLPDDNFTRGFVIAVLAAVFFGAGFIARKWGLSYFPSAIGGAFFGACTALSMIILGSMVRGDIRRLVEDNLRRIPWWFVAGGAATSIGLFFQFSAFEYLPAWMVGLLQATQALWTLLWARLFLRDEEQINRALLVSVALVVVGVAIMTYGL
jgi:drug/metabolite transporter (DMT)-like permease